LTIYYTTAYPIPGNPILNPVTYSKKYVAPPNVRRRILADDDGVELFADNLNLVGYIVILILAITMIIWNDN